MMAPDSYHVGMVLVGLGLILAYWLPRFVSGREPAAAALVIGAGSITGLLLPDLAQAIIPTKWPDYWEHVSEIALIIGLFGTGLRIDRLKSWENWKPTLRLLIFAMPAAIASLWFLGLAFGGLTLAGGLLLGAVLAPTDPLLANEVQVGPPLEGGEHPVRFTLTTEAGLNDGLAFPFVYLALGIAGAGAITSNVLFNWVFIDVLYRISAGLALGIVIGLALGKVMFDVPKRNPLAQTGSGVVAIAGVLLCYGLTEWLEGYGFIAVFAAGVALRHSESRHEFHRTLHGFTDTTEQVLTAILLFALGVVMPALLVGLNVAHASIALALVFIVRPLFAWISLSRTTLAGRSRAVVAFYGIRGLGSIYYMAYASTHFDLTNDAALWSIVAFTILVSTIVHGLSAGLAIERVTETTAKSNDAEGGRPALDTNG
jgi:sodium/hydrogen antiporter